MRISYPTLYACNLAAIAPVSFCEVEIASCPIHQLHSIPRPRAAVVICHKVSEATGRTRWYWNYPHATLRFRNQRAFSGREILGENLGGGWRRIVDSDSGQFHWAVCYLPACGWHLG